MCRFLTDLFSADVHVLIPPFILAAKTCVLQFSASLDWLAPCVPGINSHFPGWHLKAEPTQPGCRGQKSWLIGCYPLALIYTLSTTCTGFLKVSLFVPFRPAFKTLLYNLHWFIHFNLAFQRMKQDYIGNFSWKMVFSRVSKEYVYSELTYFQ